MMGTAPRLEGFDVIVDDDAALWRRVRGLRARLNESMKALESVLPASASRVLGRGHVTVLLTSNVRVHALNKAFRGVDKPTNVLSFPRVEGPELARSREPLFLGDLALAFGVVKTEAQAEGKRLLDHTTHLTIHGVLHLLGYDHGNDTDASRMERLECRALAVLGLPDPYAPVNPTPPHGSGKKGGS